jgi:hypothetical protein
LKDRPKCVEEPAVRIDLLLIFLLQAKDDLHGKNTLLRTSILFDGVTEISEKKRKTAAKTNVGHTHSE